MKNIKTYLIALILLTGSSFIFTSCEEEIITPEREKLSTSTDGSGMEDDGQFD